MPSNKTFLQIGLGSMGKRRIRNLKVHKQEQIFGFDLSKERREAVEKEYGVKTVGSLETLDLTTIDAVLISTPPDRHGDYIRWALKNGKSFFVEPGTVDDGYKEVIADTQAIVKAPACSWRYFLAMKLMKEKLDSGAIGKVLAFQYHMGQYLPDWHPWEDYRQVYFSGKVTGACREMLPFELIWLNWLLGDRVQEISGYITKVSDLDMPSDDIITANLKYTKNTLGNVIIDVIARKAFRTLKMLGTDGVLEWQWLDSVIKIWKPGAKEPEIIEVPKGNSHKGYLTIEEMYIDEIGAFLDALDGTHPYPYTFEEDWQILKTLFALEKAFQTKQYQQV